MRTRTSFQKRQKEIARAEKQRDKAAKRMQKKLVGKQPLESEEMLTAELEAAELNEAAEGPEEAPAGELD